MNRGRGFRGRRGYGRHQGNGYNNQYQDSQGRNTPAPRKRLRPSLIGSKALNPEDLPIFQEKTRIMQNIAAWKVVVIQGDTGCGKTTQVPKYILEAAQEKGQHCKIIVTQPRRIACIGVANRVADELGVSLGDEIGYHIRGDKRYSEHTKITFMTNGMFIQEIVGIPRGQDLPWTHVIMDEVHERAVESEFLMVIMKHYLCTQFKIKLILMSATIDAQLFASYFSEKSIAEVFTILPEIAEQNQAEIDWGNLWNGNTQNAHNYTSKITATAETHVGSKYDESEWAPILPVGNKCFDVEIWYLEDIVEEINLTIRKSPEEKIQLEDIRNRFFRGNNPDDVIGNIETDFYNIWADIIRMQHTKQVFEEDRPRTFLVFLPGINEINVMYDTLQEDKTKYNFDVLMLHSSLPEEVHSQIFTEPDFGQRRIILSTNIAESSITLPDVRYVIDFCYNKDITYNKKTMTEMLELHWGSKATMQQRSGRAGRVAKGIGFRLISKEFYENTMQDFSKPEIQRCPLDKLILKVKQLDIGEPIDILGRCVQPPDHADVLLAQNYLGEMGALTDCNELTWLGKVYADLPCDIRISRLCLFGFLFGCMDETILMASILALDRPVFKSFQGLPFRFSWEEHFVYLAKVRFDEGANSDVILCLTAYQEWYKLFGREVKRIMFDKRYLNRGIRPRPGPDETQWCKVNYIEPTQMRNILMNYKELKQRLRKLNMSNEIINSSIDYRKDRDGLLALKICMAGAFAGKYLHCEYKTDQDPSRIRKSKAIGTDVDSTIIIQGVESFITADDIAKMLKSQLNMDPNLFSIEIRHRDAFIKFHNDPRHLQKKAVLWLGNSPNRYRQGDFIQILERLVNRDDGVVQQTKNIPLPCCDQPPTEQHRRAIRTAQDNLPRIKRSATTNVVDWHQFAKNSAQNLELCVYFYPRPDHCHLIRTKDLTSGFEIQVDEDSINGFIIETNPKIVQSKMVICWDYVDKSSKTVGRNTTLMPDYSLICQLMTLVFSRSAMFISDEDNSYYDGFTIQSTDRFIPFDFRFNGKDVQDINAIRYEISDKLYNDRYIKQTTIPDIFSKIKAILIKKRLPIVRGFSLVKAEMGEKSNAIGYRLKTIEKKEEEFYREMYLEPLDYLDIKEDERIWTLDGQMDLEQEQFNIRERKFQYIEDLKKRAKRLELKVAHIACKRCLSQLCSYNALELGALETNNFIVILRGIFGTVVFDEKRWENDPFVQHYFSTYGQAPDKWALCTNRHIVGWKIGQDTLVDQNSPLIVIFPGEEIEQWNVNLVQNQFYQLRKKNDEYSALMKQNLGDLTCNICAGEKFKSEDDFIRHVMYKPEHQDNVSVFLADAIQ